MLLDELKEGKLYSKRILLKILKSYKQEHRVGIGVTKHVIERREAAGVKEYLAATRDPLTNWRVYTKKNIQDILDFEIKYVKEKWKR